MTVHTTYNTEEWNILHQNKHKTKSTEKPVGRRFHLDVRTHRQTDNPKHNASGHIYRRNKQWQQWQ